jgi:hypothetical protein
LTPFATMHKWEALSSLRREEPTMPLLKPALPTQVRAFHASISRAGYYHYLRAGRRVWASACRYPDPSSKPIAADFGWMRLRDSHRLTLRARVRDFGLAEIPRTVLLVQTIAGDQLVAMGAVPPNAWQAISATADQGIPGCSNHPAWAAANLAALASAMART